MARRRLLDTTRGYGPAARHVRFGLYGNPFAGKSNDIAQRVEWHKNFGYVALATFSLLSVWRIARHRRWGGFEGGAFALVNGFGLLVITLTGWMGGHLWATDAQLLSNEITPAFDGARHGRHRFGRTRRSDGGHGYGRDAIRHAAPTSATPAMEQLGGMTTGGMMMSMRSTTDVTSSMARESSGTSWQPDSSPMYMIMRMHGRDQLMFHGSIYPRYTRIGSRRDVSASGSGGRSRFDAPSMFMVMLAHPLDKSNQPRSQLGLRAMLSADPFIERSYGYPLLFQTGESYKGQPIHDRQHPHDLVSELSATYSRRVGSQGSAYLYLGYPGEPALGPPTFVHRTSGIDFPTRLWATTGRIRRTSLLAWRRSATTSGASRSRGLASTGANPTRTAITSTRRAELLFGPRVVESDA